MVRRFVRLATVVQARAPQCATGHRATDCRRTAEAGKGIGNVGRAPRARAGALTSFPGGTPMKQDMALDRAIGNLSLNTTVGRALFRAALDRPEAVDHEAAMQAGSTLTEALDAFLALTGRSVSNDNR